MNEQDQRTSSESPHTVFDQDYKTRARIILKGRWNFCALTAFVYFICSSAASALPRIGSIASLAVSGPLTLGISIFVLKLVRDNNPKISNIFDGFNDFLRAFLTHLLILIFVLLWMLLLIVPGIIAALSYSMSFYILADNPELSALDAIKKSKEIMRGHKGSLFMLSLSFIGWALLALLTLGIGFFWLAPYMGTTFACFYEDIKAGDTNGQIHA